VEVAYIGWPSSRGGPRFILACKRKKQDSNRVHIRW
jgi:hypothetical protein